MNDLLRQFIEKVQRRNPAEPEFLQAVSEVAESTCPILTNIPLTETTKF